ncbi:MAG: hypothetical protein KAX49_07720 [Halanaerobiales bacterium]|nr:hypothetical protein [Halanaerobiales bacterium]
MNKFKITAFVLVLIFLMSGYALAEENNSTNGVTVNVNMNNTMTDFRNEAVFSIGVTSPIIGSAQTKYFGEKKYTTSISGINWCIGYTKRNYFGKGLPGNGGAGYFEYGTVTLLMPYVGVGYDYRIDENLIIGIGLPDLLHISFTF